MSVYKYSYKNIKKNYKETYVILSIAMQKPTTVTILFRQFLIGFSAERRDFIEGYCYLVLIVK